LSKNYRPPIQFDELGREIKTEFQDQWEARCGIALVLKVISPFIGNEYVLKYFDFLIAKALGDRNEMVRTTMLQVGFWI
jgi:hypothetical protein